MKNIRIGFRPERPILYRFYNILLALLLIALSLPFLIVISIALLLTQGRSIIYRGERIGQNGKIFHLYKFRSLHTQGARELTKNQTLPKNSSLETPVGAFLRSARLDELPQLFNILFGDMNLVGPRPVRQEIAEIYRASIPHYDTRFEVKPGLMGPTQAYMGHGAHKKLRAKFNNMLINRKVNFIGELALIANIGISVFLSSIKGLSYVIWPNIQASRPSRISKEYNLNLATEQGNIKVICMTDQYIILDRPALGTKAELKIQIKKNKIRTLKLTLDEQQLRNNTYRFTLSSSVSIYLFDRYLDCAPVIEPWPSKRVKLGHIIRVMFVPIRNNDLQLSIDQLQTDT